jgi:hypothetical protein
MPTEPLQSRYKTMPDGSYLLQRFTLPGCNNDFADDPAKYEALAAAWSRNVDGFTRQAIFGNPWTATNAAAQTGYYHPLVTPVRPGAIAVDVAWVAFPNRLVQYLGKDQDPPNPYGLEQATLNTLADSGALAAYPIPKDPCAMSWDPAGLHPYGPYGPRGWLDEYCEFSVARDRDGRMVRIDFTCENPEYYQTLWRIDPQRVADVYSAALSTGAPASQAVTVTVADLQLRDPATGAPVLDPQTGRPAYNPLNRWNSGTQATRAGAAGASSGGAMHLTATPNTLQTELALGAGATVQRSAGNTDPHQLICCATYGQAYRNSDPHIGQTINLAVAKGRNIALADPPGLYIQMPSFAQYALPKDPRLPSGASAADCWHIVRGFAQLTDQVTGQPYPGSFILHAAFQLPQAWIAAGVRFGIGDITIGGVPITTGAQVLATLEIALFGRPIPAVAATPELPCTGTPQIPLAQPLQIMFAPLWNAYYDTKVVAPAPVPMRLASNSSIIPPTLVPGQSRQQLVLTCTLPGTLSQLPDVIFTGTDGKGDPAILAVVTGYVPSVTYAVPGNTYPGPVQLLYLQVSVAPSAAPGVRSLVLVPAGQSFSPALPQAPAFLVIATSQETAP